MTMDLSAINVADLSNTSDRSTSAIRRIPFDETGDLLLHKEEDESSEDDEGK